MHEFSLCEGIIQQVKRANHNQLTNISQVNIEVGKLAGVDLNSLTFWFPIVAGKFNVPELKLKVIEQDGLAKCNCCLQQFHLINLFDPCPHCASYGDYQILQGREMLIKSFALDLASSK